LARKCAYCGSVRKLSKEHVWPSGFLKKLEGNHAHYSPKSGKVHGGDYIVCDVCECCNNEKLSPLDSYFCKLYDLYFSNSRGPNEEVLFEYEYDLLARVLLKIAYNTARSAGSEISPFTRTTDYILYGAKKPAGISIIGELVSPTFVADINAPAHIKEIRPIMYRSILGQLKTPHGYAVLLRIIAVNSFFFHLLITREPYHKTIFNRAVRELITNVSGTVLLKPERKSVVLRTSPQDGLSSMLPLLQKKHKEYKEFFDKVN
jgi:hypothetical protein